MSKSIFILFLFFCILFSFSQKVLANPQIDNVDLYYKIKSLEKEKNKAVKIKETINKQIGLIYKSNVCDVITIKISDLLNESMLKKLLANV